MLLYWRMRYKGLITTAQRGIVDGKHRYVWQGIDVASVIPMFFAESCHVIRWLSIREGFTITVGASFWWEKVYKQTATKWVNINNN